VIITLWKFPSGRDHQNQNLIPVVGYFANTASFPAKSESDGTQCARKCGVVTGHYCPGMRSDSGSRTLHIAARDDLRAIARTPR